MGRHARRSTSRASLPSTASRGRARPYTSRRRPCWHRAAPRDHAREGGLLLPSPPPAPLVFFSLPGCRTCLLPAVVRGGQTNLSLNVCTELACDSRSLLQPCFLAFRCRGIVPSA